MSKELELKEALDFLSNNWKFNEKLREAFDSVFKTLDSGTDINRSHGQLLREYLEYPGSLKALSAAASLSAALQRGSGRISAGLSAATRGREYNPELVKLEDRLMQTMIRYSLGEATKHDVESEAIRHIGVNASKPTLRKFIDELRPRAEAWAVFFRQMNDAASKDGPL